MNDPITGLPITTKPPKVTPGGILAGTGAVSTSPAVTNKGGFTYPDYTALLQQWMAPYLQQYQGDIAAARAGLTADVDTARERYQQGDTSILARLKGVHEDNLLGITNNLAARGILQSGETKYQNDRENLGYKRTRYDAENQLLDYLKGVQKAFADFQQQRALQLAQQQQDVAETVGQVYQPTYTAPGTSPYVNWARGLFSSAPGY